MISGDIVVGREYLCSDGSRSRVDDVHRNEVTFTQITAGNPHAPPPGGAYTWDLDLFRVDHTEIVTPAPESPILAMVPASARARVVAVSWLDDHDNLCRVENTGPAGTGAPQARTFAGGLTADQVHEIVKRVRASMAENTSGPGGKDLWDQGYDSGAEFALARLSEAIGEDL